jgi:ABC-type lipoprotein release transport system permease subunit
MGKFLLLAFLNIFRNRRRTVMTLIVVGGGVAGLLLVGGFFARMFWGLREQTINNGLGHIQIFTADHFIRDEVRVLDTGIDNWRQVAAELATYYKQVRSLFSMIFVFLGVIVFFMVLMSSVNTLLMTMFERTREIGTMLAMGTPRVWIVALFMVEATLLGILGALVGVAGGQSSRRPLEPLRACTAAAAGLTPVPMPFRFFTCPA